MSGRGLQIVAPWWAWRRQVEGHVASSPRGTRPHLQKFDRPDFVDGFMKDPQRSLKFVDDDCYSTHTLLSGAQAAISKIAFKKDLLFSGTTKSGEKNPSAVLTQKSCLRKLFLETHKRSYAVVCEVHCDEAGFPHATGEDICQAGFVVRRRLLQISKDAKKDAKALIADIAGLQRQLTVLSDTALSLQRVVPRRPTLAQKLQSEGTLEAERSFAKDKLAQKRAELLKWKEDTGTAWVHEGWVPTEFEGVGQWQVVEDGPQQLEEAYFPLHRLMPAEADLKHDAQGKAIYFGVVPTSALDTDRTGQPRFDDQHVYEIRCFVRRHKPGCPRTEEEPDCHGELFWSAPSEPFRIAAPFDLVGTAQRPVTIVQPDLAELAAMAHSRPIGRLSPVRLVQKQSLKPKLDGASLSGGSMGAGAVCFFAIPLITLVAMFLFSIFLPIVVFIFGLWFLLALRFCIPPSLSLDAGLAAEFDALGGVGVDLSASFSITFNDGGISRTLNQDQVPLDVMNRLGKLVTGKFPDPLPADQVPSVPELYATLKDLDDAAKEGQAQADSGLPPTGGLDLLAGLEFEPRESWPVVLPGVPA